LQLQVDPAPPNSRDFNLFYQNYWILQIFFGPYGGFKVVCSKIAGQTVGDKYFNSKGLKQAARDF
jgi:hypothetical protein